MSFTTYGVPRELQSRLKKEIDNIRNDEAVNQVFGITYDFAIHRLERVVAKWAGHRNVRIRQFVTPCDIFPQFEILLLDIKWRFLYSLATINER